MDEELKEKLKNAMESGKDAVGEMKEVIKGISREVGLKSQEEGKDVQKAASELLTEIGSNLKALGKNSIEYMQAVFSGVLEGLKESDEDGDSHLKGAFLSFGKAFRGLFDAGLFVSKESFKSFKLFVHEKTQELLKKNAGKQEAKKEEADNQD